MGEDRQAPSERRFFVEVTGQGRKALRTLQALDMDLFVSTFRRDEERLSIEGLLSLAEVERLVDAGFTVTIQADESKRSRAHQTIDFREWLAGMEEDLGRIKGE